MAVPSNSEYDGVTEMLRELLTVDKESVEYRRQRDAVITRCLPLADHMARRFDSRGEPREDLVQVARIGLIQAVNRFDGGFDSDFLAFAIPTMMGEIRRHFRDHGWAVKVPRRMKELGPQLKRASEALYQELGRAPTASEIAGRLGLDREEVVRAQIAATAYSTLSYDAPGPGSDDDEGRSIGDNFGYLDTRLDKVVDVESVRPLLAALPERDQHVLMLRFFENMTQSQIAEQLGISQMHVSRLLARSLATLRDQVATPEMVAALPARGPRARRKSPATQRIRQRTA